MTATHTVLRLWTRPEPGAALLEKRSLSLVEGQGIEGDHTFARMRHVTIVFADDWAEALRELGPDVDPSGRRANVFVSGGDGKRFIGQTIALGGARIDVKGEVKPCPTMNEAAEGLEVALRPGGRAGVWGRVTRGAEVALGDALEPA
jgi:MOSC domain-containing protein YiiM